MNTASKHNFFNNPKANKIVLVASFFTFIYWIIAINVNVYAIAITGAFFELTAIPMLLSLALLPIVSIVLLSKTKFSLKSLSIYSLSILVITIVIVLNKK